MQKDVMKLIQNEKERYMKILSKIEKEMKQAPKGELIVRKSKGKYDQYYVSLHDKNGQRREEYLSKKEIHKIQALAQKEYNLEVKAYIEERMGAYDKVLKVKRKNRLSEIFDNIHPSLKQFITPVTLSDAQFIEEWKRKNPGDQNTMDKRIKLKTMQGEIVRSKSEKIIADMFYQEKTHIFMNRK